MNLGDESLWVRFNAAFLRRAFLSGGTLVLLIILTRLLYSDFERERDLQSWVMHTYEVLNQVQFLTSTVDRAESAERGYLLTKDARYLDAFQSALRTEQSTRLSLSRLSEDNPGQQTRLAAAQQLAEARFSLLQEAITIRQTATADAALSKVRASKGKRIMDEWRVALHALEGVEHDLLVKRMAAVKAQSMRTRWVLGLGSGLLVMLLVAAGVVLERDIQNRERAREAERKSQERLRLALDSANAGSWEWDLRTNENVWSEELWKLYGLEPGSCQPSYEAWRQAVHPDDRAEAERIVGEAAHAGTEMSVEFRVSDPNSGQRWLLARARPLRNATGHAEVFVGIALDITHRKRTELEIRQLNARLEQRVSQRTAELETANKELEAFSYSVSHDLRAPLRGIDGWSLALAEDYAGQLDQRALQYLDRVRSETQRMGLLIDDMLQLSRISCTEIRFAPVDLSAVAHGIATRLREANSVRHLEFVIEPDLTATGDARLLEIAVTNLLTNAVKFTGPRKEARIEFGLTNGNGEAAFYVRDNGVGFDMTYAGALFRAFQRLHKASEFPGTGIGLAIVQRVIGRHRGRVWAEAERDRGATFFFTIGPSA